MTDTGKLLRQSGEAEAEGDYIEALRLAGEVARLDPGHDFARLKIASVLSTMAIQQGRILADWNLVETAQDVARKVAELLFARGRLMFAMAVCRVGLDIDASDEQLHDTMDKIQAQLDVTAPPFGVTAFDPRAPMPVDEQDPDCMMSVGPGRDVFERAVDLATATSFGSEPPPRPLPVPIFSNLSHEPFVAIVETMSLVRLPADHMVIKQGQIESSVYVLLQGRVQVTRVAKGKQEVLGELGPGEIFGEMSLMFTEPRSATVTTLEAVELLHLSGEQIADVVDRYPEAGSELERMAGERLLLFSCGDGKFFSSLEMDAKSEIVRKMTFHVVPQGEVVLEQSEEPTGMYFVVSGEIGITRFDDAGEEHEVGSLGPGGILGEMALVGHELTTARATALADTLMFHLDQIEFDSVLEENPEVRTYLEKLSARRELELEAAVAPEDEDFDASEAATRCLLL